MVKLRRGWRVASGRRVFVGPNAPGEFDPTAELPQGTRLEPMVPDLAKADPRSLSADEEELARYVHVVPPEGTSPAELLSKVRKWPCVSEARLPPEASLPDSPAPAP